MKSLFERLKDMVFKNTNRGTDSFFNGKDEIDRGAEKVTENEKNQLSTEGQEKEMCAYDLIMAKEYLRGVKILAIGKAGFDTIETIRNCSEYRLTLTQSLVWHPEWLFIIADFSEEGVKEKAFRCGDLWSRKKEEKSDKVICITLDSITQDDLKETEMHFDMCLLVENKEELHLPMLVFRNFNVNGVIGVDFADVLGMLEDSSLLYCCEIRYDNFNDLQKNFNSFFIDHCTQYEKGEKTENRIISLRVSRDFSLQEIDYVHEIISKQTSGDIVVSCLLNEDENDKSWTVSLLSAISDKRIDDVDIDKLMDIKHEE